MKSSTVTIVLLCVVIINQMAFFLDIKELKAMCTSYSNTVGLLKAGSAKATMDYSKVVIHFDSLIAGDTLIPVYYKPLLKEKK